LGRFWLAKKKKRTIEMASANQAYREAVNSPAPVVGPQKPPSPPPRAQGPWVRRLPMWPVMSPPAVEAFYEAHAAMKRNPLMAVAIALGLGFVVGVFTRARR
jgi:hypothetical protein